MAGKVNIHLTNFDAIAAADTTDNGYFLDVIGNKSDSAAVTSTASTIALLRYIIANLNSDADVAALIGAIDTAAHTGATDNVTTLMGYLKQAITDLIGIKGAGWTSENLATIDLNVDGIVTDVGDPSGHTITDLSSKIGDIARSLDLVLGDRWDASGDLGSDVADIIAALGVSGAISGTADSGTTSTLVDAALVQANDYFNGMILVMTSGNNTGLARTITDFVAASDTVTVEPAFPSAVST
ncbi:MAG: hypothetical protein U9O94_10980, partial [Nanoarchaeota archaeon]|nr:hypothetical protein [Nanoarchaeota archaeon]